jgi:hypothetical protein
MKRHVANGHVVGSTGSPRKVLPSHEDPVGGTPSPLADLVALMRERAATSGNPAYAREYRLALAAWEAERPPDVLPPWDPHTDPEWVGLREAIVAALEPYPEALEAVRLALVRHNAEEAVDGSIPGTTQYR